MIAITTSNSIKENPFPPSYLEPGVMEVNLVTRLHLQRILHGSAIRMEPDRRRTRCQRRKR
jgi:hypothetical protein